MLIEAHIFKVSPDETLEALMSPFKHQILSSPIVDLKGL